MDPTRNPYSSGPSVPPPMLAGRQAILDQAEAWLKRLAQGKGGRSLALLGLHGSGKTVLLAALVRLAERQGLPTRPLYSLPELQADAGPQPGLWLVDQAHAWGAAGLAHLLRRQEQFLAAQAPRAIVLAGLPLQQQLDDASLRLLERCFEVQRLEPLGPTDAEAALRDPAQALGVAWQPEALREALRLGKGWPALLQAWAYATWDLAAGPDLGREDLRQAAPMVTARLDRDLYGPGYERLSPREKTYLRTMAHLGPGPHRSSDIADSMDAKITSLGPLRAKLIAGGWIYSPGHGLQAFAAPGMDEYMRRVMPGFR